MEYAPLEQAPDPFSYDGSYAVEDAGSEIPYDGEIGAGGGGEEVDVARVVVIAEVEAVGQAVHRVSVADLAGRTQVDSSQIAHT